MTLGDYAKKYYVEESLMEKTKEPTAIVIYLEDNLTGMQQTIPVPPAPEKKPAFQSAPKPAFQPPKKPVDIRSP